MCACARARVRARASHSPAASLQRLHHDALAHRVDVEVSLVPVGWTRTHGYYVTSLVCPSIAVVFALPDEGGVPLWCVHECVPSSELCTKRTSAYNGKAVSTRERERARDRKKEKEKEKEKSVRDRDVHMTHTSHQSHVRMVFGLRATATHHNQSVPAPRVNQPLAHLRHWSAARHWLPVLPAVSRAQRYIKSPSYDHEAFILKDNSVKGTCVYER